MKAQPEPQVLQVSRVLQVLLDFLVLMEPQEQQAFKVMLARQARLD
jgi:hypothetical protein